MRMNEDMMMNENMMNEMMMNENKMNGIREWMKISQCCLKKGEKMGYLLLTCEKSNIQVIIPVFNN